MKREILITISLLILSNAAWSQKAPDGFHGIKWGVTRQQVKETLDLIPHSSCYDFENFILFSYEDEEQNKIGEVFVSDYEFTFSKSDKFYQFLVRFRKAHLHNLHNFDVLLRAMKSKYGNPSKTVPLMAQINPKAKIGTLYTWIVENKVEITLWYNDMEELKINGNLLYTNLSIERETEKARDKDITKTKDKLA